MFFPFAQAQPEGTDFRQIIDTIARTPLSEVVIFVVVCTVLRLVLAPYLAKTEPHRRTGAYGFAKFSNEALDAVIYAGVFVFMLIRPFAVQAFIIPSPSMVNTLQVNDLIVANKAIYRYTDPKVRDIVVFRPPIYATTPDQRDGNEPKVDFIKRCQGIAGDVVEIRDGKLYRNGQPVDEPYLRDPVMTFDWKLVKYDGFYEPWKGRYVPVVMGRGGELPNYGNMIAKEFAVGVTDAERQNPEPFVRDWVPLPAFSPEQQRLMDELRELPPAAVPKGYILMFGDNREGSFDSRSWGLVAVDDVVGRSEAIWFPLRRMGSTR